MVPINHPPKALPAQLAAEVHRHERSFSGVLALWVHDLRRRETYGLRADEVFPPASTIKFLVLFEAFRRAEAGLLQLSEEIELRKEDAVAGSGVLKDLTPGLRLTVGDAAMLMITVSDNVAANLLIRRLGAPAINRAARAAGLQRTRLSGQFLHGHASSSTATAGELGDLMTRIARRRLVSRQASAAMLAILRREQYDNIVGRLLPDRLPDGRQLRQPWRVASKSGSQEGVRNDVAFVDGNGISYVVALMSRECRDLRFSPDNEASVCLARIARAVHDYVASGAAQTRNGNPGPRGAPRPVPAALA